MQLLFILLRIFEVILVIRIVMSWFRPDPTHPIVNFIYRVTDPVLEPVRRLLPIQAMGFDLSPIVIFVAINMIKRFLIRSMFLY